MGSALGGILKVDDFAAVTFANFGELSNQYVFASRITACKP